MVNILNVIKEELVAVSLSKCEDNTMDDSIKTHQDKLELIFMKNIKETKGKVS